MRKSLLKSLLVLGIPVVMLSCVDDAYLNQPKPVADQTFMEEFDTLSSAYARGWRFINRSVPMGPGVWSQGAASFPAYSTRGSVQGYASVDSFSTSGNATVTAIASNWIVSPVTYIKNGDVISFYTRAQRVGIRGLPGDSTDRINRLQVRINANNDGLNVGSGAETGDFDLSLLDINPTYVEDYRPGGAAPAVPTTAFPTVWTKFEAKVYGLAKPIWGRFSFRYFVEGAGPAAAEAGGVVGIDRVTFTSAK